MSVRLISHIVLTLILFAIGWWLYLRIGDAGALDSVEVAKYWFAMLVYVFFSWVFYWIAHWFRLRVWLAMQVLAILISAISTGALLYISREHQQQVEEKVTQQQEGIDSDAEKNDVLDSESEIEKLSLTEDSEFDGPEISAPEQNNDSN
jgi:thiol:disulfide interchange protein